MSELRVLRHRELRARVRADRDGVREGLSPVRGQAPRRSRGQEGALDTREQLAATDCLRRDTDPSRHDRLRRAFAPRLRPASIRPRPPSYRSAVRQPVSRTDTASPGRGRRGNLGRPARRSPVRRRVSPCRSVSVPDGPGGLVARLRHPSPPLGDRVDPLVGDRPEEVGVDGQRHSPLGALEVNVGPVLQVNVGPVRRQQDVVRRVRLGAPQ